MNELFISVSGKLADALLAKGVNVSEDSINALRQAIRNGKFKYVQFTNRKPKKLFRNLLN